MRIRFKDLEDKVYRVVDCTEFGREYFGKDDIEYFVIYIETNPACDVSRYISEFPTDKYNLDYELATKKLLELGYLDLSGMCFEYCSDRDDADDTADAYVEENGVPTDDDSEDADEDSETESVDTEDEDSAEEDTEDIKVENNGSSLFNVAPLIDINNL